MPIRTIAIVGSLALGACARQPLVVDSACQLRPISYSAPRAGEAETLDNRFDTRETIAEIREQNAALRKLCP